MDSVADTELLAVAVALADAETLSELVAVLDGLAPSDKDAVGLWLRSKRSLKEMLTQKSKRCSKVMPSDREADGLNERVPLSELV